MKLKLIKFQSDDFEFYYSLVSSVDVMKQITERAVPYDEAKIKFQKLMSNNVKYDGFGTYKIYSYLDDRLIGLGYLLVNEEKMTEAEIGFMFLPDFWGKGYGTETARQLVEIAKRQDIRLIRAIIETSNVPSRRDLISLGFDSFEFRMIDGLLGEILCKDM